MRLICRGSLRAIRNSWGKGKHSGSFYPLLSTHGKNYQVFAVLTNGKIEIEYKFLKNYSRSPTKRRFESSSVCSTRSPVFRYLVMDIPLSPGFHSAP